MIVTAVTLLFAVIASVSIAQNSPNQDTYIVQKGDVLFTLEGNYSGNPQQWGRLVTLNPFLQDPGRTWIDKKGRTIVLIKPGEELHGLGELGIIPQPLSLDLLIPSVPPTKQRSYFSLWMSAIIATILILLCIIQKLLRNPFWAGPAMVPGGVTNETVSSQFRTNLIWPTTTMTDHIEVKNVVKGLLFGLVKIKYGDNSFRRIFLRGEVGFRAMVRRNDEPWSEEHMLQGCGNDLRSSGARYIPGFAFRFVPLEVIAENPQPLHTNAKTEVPQQEVKNNEDNYFNFKLEDGRPNLVKYKGIQSFEFKEEGGQSEIRFHYDVTKK